MKNLILTLVGLVSMGSSFGQDLTDALRYSSGETRVRYTQKTYECHFY